MNLEKLVDYLTKNHNSKHLILPSDLEPLNGSQIEKVKDLAQEQGFSIPLGILEILGNPTQYAH